jgi:hypothetical protein
LEKTYKRGAAKTYVNNLKKNQNPNITQKSGSSKALLSLIASLNSVSNTCNDKPAIPTIAGLTIQERKVWVNPTKLLKN